MLIACVNEHYSDWDKFLPFVIMAYRALKRDTTGLTPNHTMFGRDVSTRLDVMYEMPPAITFITHNKWAWNETLEEAHRFVRDNINTVMIRQKRYHDQKLCWQVFKQDDCMNVYFPLQKVGRSPKFTSYLQGPIKIISKMTDLTYKVDDGAQGKKKNFMLTDQYKNMTRS